MNHNLAILLALGFFSAACMINPGEIPGGPSVEDDDDDSQGDDDGQGDDDDQDDDDITGDDDSGDDDTQGDDDGQDDDTTVPYDPAGCGDDDAVFSQEIGPIDLASHHAYTLFLIGEGAGPPQALFLDEGETLQNGSLPRFRFINGAVSTSAVDVYHEGNLYSSLEHIEPGIVTPDSKPFNYWQMSWTGNHFFEAYGAGQGPPYDAALAPAVSLQMPDDSFYSSVVTCAEGNYKLQIFPDDNQPPASGTARLGLFHSVDGIGPVDVSIVEPINQLLWTDVLHGTLATPTELSWGTYLLRVESQAK